MAKKILVMGLPGSGKSYLADKLAPKLNAVWLNADRVREEANDWDFSPDGRVRQAGRYILISKLLQRETDFFPKFDEKDIEPSIAVGCINSANNIF